jgi:hypothetical protein
MLKPPWYSLSKAWFWSVWRLPCPSVSNALFKPYPWSTTTTARALRLSKVPWIIERLLPNRINHCENTTKLRPFQYQELPHDGSRDKGYSIRLLELLPGRNGDIIRCRLKHFVVSEHHKYETVSYCWGDSNDRVAIVCDDALLQIPTSLATALRGLRYHDHSWLIWADAACINQTNVKEKERQVQLMREIYSKAQRTLVWLGDERRLPISLPTKLVIAFGMVWARTRVKHLQNPQIRFFNYRYKSSELSSPFSTKFYLALIDILSNPWFQRLGCTGSCRMQKLNNNLGRL